MNTIRTVCFFSCVTLLTLTGCYPQANDIGRSPKEGTFEERQKEQEELIRRQQEVLRRQERELQDLERQKIYDDEYRKFNPHP